MYSNFEAKFGPCKTTTTENKANPHPSPLAQIGAKEADVQALSELTRALDKKVVSVDTCHLLTLDAYASKILYIYTSGVQNTVFSKSYILWKIIDLMAYIETCRKP